ncbi:putative N6-adenine-specific DNA methylase [Neolewinella xylanilytica]|uniref:Putative N6-adenine-specific DNA methylase n=1 Tax=Neolewinella xylanilytica TaxID=1514080 RepID=A0A2S6I638_9BACT|nr:class I SAM-dependent RNA methyltransferase [Neolewinella xylanilytica]PPK86605.1 putative N6-adenine-specific DNA methylase [Neolewinella xylanilytica]
MSDSLTLAFPTLAGLEDVLAAEVRELGAEDVEVGRRVVTARGTMETVYRANLELRTALRVLINIDSFTVNNEQELYDRLRANNWRKYLLPEGTLIVDVVDPGRWFRNTHFIAQLTKDAVVDQFRDKYGTRPGVDKDAPDLRIHLRITGRGETLLSVDSSGDGLHRRGYRRRTGEAPINEVLAAGLLQMAGYTGDQVLVDPMCGSGTFLVEAATLATRRPPGLLREFGFQRWPDFDLPAYSAVRQAALDRIRPAPYPILGSDIDGLAVAVTRATVERAKVDGCVELRQAAFGELAPPSVRNDPDVARLIVTNPPYEMRMETGDIEGFYREIGDTLKSNWAGYTAWLISANPAAVKSVGLRSSRKIPVMNGPVEARFVKYELYRGSKD